MATIRFDEQDSSLSFGNWSDFEKWVGGGWRTGVGHLWQQRGRFARAMVLWAIVVLSLAVFYRVSQGDDISWWLWTAWFGVAPFGGLVPAWWATDRLQCARRVHSVRRRKPYVVVSESHRHAKALWKTPGWRSPPKVEPVHHLADYRLRSSMIAGRWGLLRRGLALVGAALIVVVIEDAVAGFADALKLPDAADERWARVVQLAELTLDGLGAHDPWIAMASLVLGAVVWGMGKREARWRDRARAYTEHERRLSSDPTPAPTATQTVTQHASVQPEDNALRSDLTGVVLVSAAIGWIAGRRASN